MIDARLMGGTLDLFGGPFAEEVCGVVTREHCEETRDHLFVRSAGGAAMTDIVNIYDAKTNLSSWWTAPPRARRS